MVPTDAGYGLGFPATLFLSTVIRALLDLMCGGIFIQYQATCYVSKHTMVYGKGE